MKTNRIETGRFYAAPAVFNSLNIRYLYFFFTVLLTITFLAFLYICYGDDPSHVYLNVDQAYFKSILHSLEKHWALFPTTLENFSNTSSPYHHLDSQIKWLMTFFLPTHTAILTFWLCIYALFFYALYRLDIPFNGWILPVLFCFSLLKLPSPGEIIQMIQHPLSFSIRSDLFGNSNSMLAYVLLLVALKVKFPVRIVIYLFSFYIKSPAAPAFFIIEIYRLYAKQDPFEFRSKLIQLILVVSAFLASFAIFFYSPANQLANFTHGQNFVEFHIRADIHWFAHGRLIYDLILFMLVSMGFSSLDRPMRYLFGTMIIFLMLYDSIGLIQINIGNFYQVDRFVRFTFLLILLKEITGPNINLFWKKCLNTLILCILIYNSYFMAHFLGTIFIGNFERFTEYLDNTPLIEITSSISNSNDVVAFNTIDSPIRKNKQLQLCGIIKNPIWVSNLKYINFLSEPQVRMDWTTLQQALLGNKDFPSQIHWLVLDKAKANFNLEAIDRRFMLVKFTQTHSLYKKKNQFNVESEVQAGSDRR